MRFPEMGVRRERHVMSDQSTGKIKFTATRANGSRTLNNLIQLVPSLDYADAWILHARAAEWCKKLEVGDATPILDSQEGKPVSMRFPTSGMVSITFCPGEGKKGTWEVSAEKYNAELFFAILRSLTDRNGCSNINAEFNLTEIERE